MAITKQMEFKKVGGWGGRRPGAGRKNLSGQLAHGARPQTSAKFPLHITCKLKPDLKGLRSGRMHSAFQHAIRRAKTKGLRVVHYSILRDHFHIYAECDSNRALSSGMNSLGCSLGKSIRKHCGGSGGVFKGRYHVRILRTPHENRNVIAYVLLNRAKHEKVFAYYDTFSSGAFFNDWKMLLGSNIGPLLAEWSMKDRPPPDYLSSPRTWLARQGWQKAA